MSGDVLIVDDSLTVRMDLAEAFEAAGLGASPCATLAEVRAALARGPVSLVILDVQLPTGTASTSCGRSARPRRRRRSRC